MQLCKAFFVARVTQTSIQLYSKIVRMRCCTGQCILRHLMSYSDRLICKRRVWQKSHCENLDQKFWQNFLELWCRLSQKLQIGHLKVRSEITLSDKQILYHVYLTTVNSRLRQPMIPQLKGALSQRSPPSSKHQIKGIPFWRMLLIVTCSSPKPFYNTLSVTNLYFLLLWRTITNQSHYISCMVLLWL